MNKGENFDREYFEDGVVTGKSGYVNYRWMPELTIKMIYKMLKHLNIKDGERILDYGCAKGFLVKAFRILDIEAYGCDISSYAIENADADVRKYCQLIIGEGGAIPFDIYFDWFITKDVLEHVSEDDLDILLASARKKAKNSFHVIPLGDDNGKYIIPEYEMDKTHLLAKTRDWWIEKFKKHGWELVSFNYRVNGIKDNWTSKYAEGNGFFTFK